MGTHAGTLNKKEGLVAISKFFVINGLQIVFFAKAKYRY